jgi:hypothetical protein
MDITAICIVGFIVLGIYKLFELFVRRKERMTVIEKLPAVVNNEENSPIVFPGISFGKQDFGSWPLRIALLLVGVGLGCITAFIVEYNLFDYADYNFDNRRLMSYIDHIHFILNFSFITIFGGLGLLISYWIESKAKKK